jgi:hypothetical protein
MVYLCKFQSLDEKEKMRFNMSLISKLFYQILRRNLSKRAIPQGFSSTRYILQGGFGGTPTADSLIPTCPSSSRSGDEGLAGCRL